MQHNFELNFFAGLDRKPDLDLSLCLIYYSQGTIKELKRRKNANNLRIYDNGVIVAHLETNFSSNRDDLNMSRLFSILKRAYKSIKDSTRIQD